MSDKPNDYCEICKEPFERKHPHQILCGKPECKRERVHQNQKRNYDKIGDHSMRKCEQCGIEFQKYTTAHKRCKNCKPLYVSTAVSKKMKDYLDTKVNVSDYLRKLIKKDMNTNL